MERPGYGAAVSAGSSPTIALAPGAAFSCGKCNLCCRRAWTMAVTADEADRLRLLYPGLESTRRSPDGPGGKEILVLARRADGSCVFLEDDGCRVHREHGLDAKPDVCRRFPYFLWKDRAGNGYLHLSRMCPTVYKAEGATGERLAGDAGSLLEGARSAPDGIGGTIRFAGTARLDWGDYLRFEDRLTSLLLDERWPLDDAVAAGRELVERVMKNGMPDPSPEDLSLDLVMSAIAGRSWMPGLYRYVMAAIATVIESRRGSGEAGVFRQDMSNFFRLLISRGTMTFRSMKVVVDLRRIGLVRWPKREKPDLTPLRLFIVSHVRRKVLLDAPDIEFGYHLLIGAYATAKFYARVSAAARGRESITADDLRRGIQAVEYNLLLHRPLQGETLEKRYVKGFFRKFLFHPSYVSSMVAF